ncbi:MAG: ribosome silencing factor [Bacteroidaceae bacterium]|nr:ribosome silencing factor [Bacteroidaceae bacterium]
MINKNTDILIDKIVKGMQEKKGHDIVVADLSAIGDTICQAFVICTANSPSHAQTLAESIGDTVRKEAATKPTAVDGLRQALWVAMDYTDVIVHIFLPDMREYYDLEHLWADATLTELEDLD